MGKFGFSRKVRLRDSTAIRKAFKTKPVIVNDVRLFVIRNELDYNRYGCTFRRNFGTAVQRNTVRRTCREVLRILNPMLQQGYDVLLWFGNDTKQVSVKHNPIHRLLKKANLFLPEPYPTAQTDSL